MPEQMSAVAISEPEYAPGRFVLFRADLPGTGHWFVWCGRSMGWRPLNTTSNAFFCFFASKREARKAADKYVTLPLQTQPVQE